LLNMSLRSIMLCWKAMIIHESIAVWMRDMSGKGYIPLFTLLGNCDFGAMKVHLKIDIYIYKNIDNNIDIFYSPAYNGSRKEDTVYGRRNGL
jgi:hypothetical protein